MIIIKVNRFNQSMNIKRDINISQIFQRVCYLFLIKTIPTDYNLSMLLLVYSKAIIRCLRIGLLFSYA